MEGEAAERRRDAGGAAPGAADRAFGGLKSRLVALVLLVLALPVAAVSLLLDRTGTARVAAVEMRLAATARAFAREEATRIGQTRAVLETLAATPGIADGGPGCHAMLEAVDAATAWSRGLGVVAPDGRFVCASAAHLRRSSLGDKPYFWDAVGTGRFTVSDIVAARMGRGLIVVAALPLLAADGRVTAVLVAGLDLDWVGRLPETTGPEGDRLDAALLVDGTGRIIGASPPRPDAVGSDAAANPVVAAILAARATGGEGVVRGEMPDGVRRLVGFARLPDTEVTVALARDEEGVMAPLRRDAALAYGALLAAVVLAGLLAMWFGHAVLLRGIAAMAAAARDGRRVSEAAPDLGAAPEVHALHRALAGAEAAREATEARLTEALAHLETIASTDALTGLFNRRHFDAALAREWRGAARAEAPLSVVLLDADRFKAFNDRYGHPAGDACLRAIGAAIAAVTRRPHDQPARYGGEEFALLLPNTDAAGARHVAERLRRLVEGAGIPHGANPEGVVTVSLGVATAWPRGGDAGPAGLVEEADAALYRAKGAGRNRVEEAMGEAEATPG